MPLRYVSSESSILHFYFYFQFSYRNVTPSSLFLRNVQSTRDEFIERVKRHYVSEVQQQIGSLLVHLSFLGGLSLGGSKDLFAEPSKSVVRVSTKAAETKFHYTYPCLPSAFPSVLTSLESEPFRPRLQQPERVRQGCQLSPLLRPELESAQRA